MYEKITKFLLSNKFVLMMVSYLCAFVAIVVDKALKLITEVSSSMKESYSNSGKKSRSLNIMQALKNKDSDLDFFIWLNNNQMSQQSDSSMQVANDLVAMRTIVLSNQSSENNRIDLHGATRNQTLIFLLFCVYLIMHTGSDVKLTLITGRGLHSENSISVINQLIRDWMNNIGIKYKADSPTLGCISVEMHHDLIANKPQAVINLVNKYNNN